MLLLLLGAEDIKELISGCWCVGQGGLRARRACRACAGGRRIEFRHYIQAKSIHNSGPDGAKPCGGRAAGGHPGRNRILGTRQKCLGKWR
eukprot:6228905-Prymnesium_polylepis.1